ncbi:hypothetical protein ACXZ1M_27330 [Duganella sp. PWIR1]
MADISREEIDAKLLREEALRNVQIAAVLGKLDVIVARLDAHDIRFERLEQGLRDAVTSITNLKGTIIITGISSVIAIILCMAGFNAALLSNMMASFESGKQTGQWQSDIRKQAFETDQKLTQVSKQIEANDALQKQISAELERIKQERASGRK